MSLKTLAARLFIWVDYLPLITLILQNNTINWEALWSNFCGL